MTRGQAPLVWVVMGVAGSGKTSMGRLLAARLDCDFLEGDRRHSVANIHKMAAQIPLTEDDRQQWLEAIVDDLRRVINNQQETVITCSGLKQVHRQQLLALERVQLVWLNVPQPELQRRLAQRDNHYMQATMLASQLAAFETTDSETSILTVDATGYPADVVEQVWQQAVSRYPDLNRSWWQR